MEINTRPIFGVAFKSGTYTTPETAISCGVKTIGSCLERREITHHRCSRILLSKNMIIQRPLTEISNRNARFVTKEPVGKFQQIVSATVFAVIAGKMFILFRRSKRCSLSESAPVTKTCFSVSVSNSNSAALRLSACPNSS